jgi:L-lactate permease
MMVKVFLPIWIISWVVLFPITTVGTRADTGSVDNLDKLTYGNVSQEQRDRYAAHVVLAWVFTCEPNLNC